MTIMRRVLLAAAAGGALLTMGALLPGLAVASGIYVSSNTRVSISTDTANPTAVFVRDQQAKRTCLLNQTTNQVLIGNQATTFHTSASTGTFRISGTASGTNASLICLDGQGHPYVDSLYAVADADAPINLDVLRLK